MAGRHAGLYAACVSGEPQRAEVLAALQFREIAQTFENLAEKAGGAPRKAGFFGRLWSGITLKRVVTVLATLLTIWIIPQLTREVQDRATVRDLKAGLAEDISSTYGDFRSVAVTRANDLWQRQLSGGTLAFSRNGKVVNPKPRLILDRNEFNTTYEKWTGESQSIRARLDTYFSHDSLGNVWAALANSLTAMYFLTQNTRDRHTLVTFLPNLKSNVEDFNKWAQFEGKPFHRITLTSSDLTNIADGQSTRSRIAPFYGSYIAVIYELDTEQAALVERLFNAPASGFSTRPCDVLSTSLTLEPGTLCP